MFSLFQQAAVNSIHVNEIDTMINDITLIDIREPYEYAGGHIRTARNIPMGNLMSQPDKYLDKNKKYYIMCQSGGRSTSTVNALFKAGYDVVNVKGGMGSYQGKNR